MKEELINGYQTFTSYSNTAIGTPAFYNTYSYNSGPIIGETRLDFEAKIIKVYNGAEWMMVKMFNHLTDLEIAVKEMKKEISSEF